jgi:photosystem II stability/assembly factor-like uncharacterized protein
LLTFALAGAVLAQGGQPEGQEPASPGSGWEVQSVPSGTFFIDIDAVDPSSAWAVGMGNSFEGAIYNTVDGGTNWNPQDSGVYAQLMGVSAVDDSIVYAGGQRSSADGLNVGLKTVNGGGTWNTIYQSPSLNIFDVLAVDADTVWAVGVDGDPPDANGYIAKSEDGGLNWVFQYYQPDYYLMRIFAAGPDVLWATGANIYTLEGLLLKTTDGGDSWVTQVPGTACIGWVAPVDAQTAWGAGYYPDDGTGVILKTTDGGESWVDKYITVAGGFTDISCVDENTAWALGGIQSESLMILKTSDGGDTWVSQDIPESCYLLAIEAVDQCTAWAVGGQAPPPANGIILKTSDGGDANPDIVSLSPSSGVEGEEVTVSGCDFGDVQDPSSHVSFGAVHATHYISWSDTELVALVPLGLSGKVDVRVTTPEGTSNPVDFTVAAPLSVTSISPDSAPQFAFSADLAVGGEGFQSGATVSLVKGTSVISGVNVKAPTPNQLTCSVWIFGAQPGSYDVVVRNPDGGEALLPGGFTVTSPCGTGGASALLLLGLALGLLSVAGSARLRKRRRR